MKPSRESYPSESSSLLHRAPWRSETYESHRRPKQYNRQVFRRWAADELNWDEGWDPFPPIASKREQRLPRARKKNAFDDEGPF